MGTSSVMPVPECATAPADVSDVLAANTQNRLFCANRGGVAEKGRGACGEYGRDEKKTRGLCRDHGSRFLPCWAPRRSGCIHAEPYPPLKRVNLRASLSPAQQVPHPALHFSSFDRTAPSSFVRTTTRIWQCPAIWREHKRRHHYYGSTGKRRHDGVNDA